MQPDATPGGAPDWAAIKHDYLNTRLTLPALYAKHGVSAQMLRTVRQREGWPSRLPRKAQLMNLLERLTLVVDRQLRILEDLDVDMPEDKKAALANMLARTLEKVSELRRETASRHASPAESREAQALRERLKARLVELDR